MYSMDSSDNTHPLSLSPETLSPAEFAKLAEVFLDFYQDGKYSLEGIEDGESTQSQRKSIKNDFKDHIYGDAKFRRTNGKDAKKKWSRYTMCMFRATLEAETKKLCDLRRKYRRVNKELDEFKNRDPAVRKAEMDAEVKRIVPIKVEEFIQERIALADRMNARIPKYQKTIDQQAQEIKDLRDQIFDSVPRKALEDATEEVLAMKLQVEKYKKIYDRRQIQLQNKEQDEEAKAIAKAQAEEAKATAKRVEESEKRRLRREALQKEIQELDEAITTDIDGMIELTGGTEVETIAIDLE